MSDLHAVRRRRKRRRRLRRPPGLPKLTTPLTEAMVDRLFWRAGFGPTAELRQRFTGKFASEAVSYLLDTPQGALVGTAPTHDGLPLDPLGDQSDTDAVLAWVDRMIRSQNPLPERLAFFWHRHFANSKADVSPAVLMLRQNDLFRRYGDLGANPGASFRGLVQDITTDGAMLRYLTGEYNRRGHPNENYARELMELFCTGVYDDAGAHIYHEGADGEVQQLAKALSGWSLEGDGEQIHAVFHPEYWYNGPKVAFGQRGNWKAQEACDLVLQQPAHAPFLMRKLWGEFVQSPPDPSTLKALVQTYTAEGTRLKPVLRLILTHPALYESIGEPNMLKPPVVFAVGVMRALGVPITDDTIVRYLDDMGQVPYFPPNVAGWEGGESWINTNTVLSRFEFVGRLLRDGGPATPQPGANGETADQALDAAYAAAGRPWLADGTRASLRTLAGQLPGATAPDRTQRQRLLRALILAGPDAQVM